MTLSVLSSCHHNKGSDADFLQKHRRRRALKSSSNGHLLHVIDSVITSVHRMSIAAFVWISLNVHNLLHRNPNPRSVCQSKLSIKKIQKDDFLLSVSVPSFIPPSLILLLVSLLKAVRGHYGKGQGSHSPLPQMARYVHESHKLVIGHGWTGEYVCYVGRLKGSMHLVNARLVVRNAAKT